jgi:hypothetical protein
MLLWQDPDFKRPLKDKADSLLIFMKIQLDKVGLEFQDYKQYGKLCEHGKIRCLIKP